jgi:GT2 family glycosyltransferase
MAVPTVAVIVLNWNGKADTLACLRSLAKLMYPEANVVVVDNGSADGSVAAIRSEFPTLAVLETGANLGFAEGNNVGIRHAMAHGADYVLLLNNDTEVAPDLVGALLDAHKQFPRAGVIGPKMYYFDDPRRIWYAGGLWDVSGQCFQQRGDGERDHGQYDTAGATEYVVGCAMFIPRPVLEHVGLLDPMFFLNYEEIDFGTRAKAAGYELVYAPGGRLWHKVSASFGGAESPLKVYYTFRNRLLWARRHLGWRQRLRIASRVAAVLTQRFLRPLLQPWLIVTAPRRYLWQVRGAFTSPVSLAVAMGVRDYWRNSFGACPTDVMQLQRRWNELRAPRLDSERA